MNINQNREIKFRVWNKRTNSWVHKPSEEVNLFGEMILLGGFMRGVGVEELNDCVALQYTGLKDKKNKEIYEGDILRINNELVGEIKFDKFHDDHGLLCYGYFVSFDEGDCYDIIQYVAFPDSYEKVEVIGNVFENPELLK